MRWSRGVFTATGLDAADLIVLAAGEHLFQYEAEPNRRNLFWRTLPAFAARAHGKPCLAMPSTFGPFEGTEGQALVRGLLADRGASGRARCPLARPSGRDGRRWRPGGRARPRLLPAAARPCHPTGCAAHPRGW